MLDWPGMADVTELLEAWRAGDTSALDRLIPLVYDDLRRLARNMARGQFGTPARGTTLVHDLYLRLAGQTHPEIQSRVHFFAVSSRAMRQILVDGARRVHAQRRGGGAVETLEDNVEAGNDRGSLELLELNDALDRLGALYPRRAQIIELRYFGGLSAEETAEVLSVSTETVRREMRLGEAWLGELLGSNG